MAIGTQSAINAINAINASMMPKIINAVSIAPILPTSECLQSSVFKPKNPRFKLISTVKINDGNIAA